MDTYCETHRSARQKFSQNAMPFLTSLALHAAVIALGLATLKAVQIAQAPREIVPTFTPATELIDAPPGNSASPGFARSLQMAQDKEPAGAVGGFNDSKGPPVEMKQAAGADAAEAVIGVGLTAGRMPGSSSGAGGDPALFGPAASGLIGGSGAGSSLFVCHNRAAHSVVYVCDASGSMMEKMPALRLELVKAIDALRPVQSFNIVFFQESGARALSPDLLAATPANKRKAQSFIEDVPAVGTTRPLPGIELAFRLHPQLIYLLTDGDFPDNRAVGDRVAQMNQDKAVKVNTIAFVSASDSDQDFLALLKQVAQNNGGVFRHVREDELGK